MFLKPAELHEVYEIIDKICEGKSFGVDKTPPKVIKWAPDIFAPILLIIINKCIDLGYYPEGMKTGEVAPI